MQKQRVFIQAWTWPSNLSSLVEVMEGVELVQTLPIYHGSRVRDILLGSYMIGRHLLGAFLLASNDFSLVGISVPSLINLL